MIGAGLIVTGISGLVSLFILEKPESTAQEEYGGGGLTFIDRLLRRERERQYCPICGGRVHFYSNLGPFAGLSGGWYCRNCKKEVVLPTRSPQYRQEQREKRRLMS
jgi:ribosomal protein L37AE/L43A